MKLVVGLGNPGAEHRNNRHNVGYQVVDRFATTPWTMLNTKLHGDPLCSIANGNIDGQCVIVMKPYLGFMNNSGQPVKHFTELFFDVEEVIVVYDDMELDLGDINIRPTAGSGHHNGIKSIVKNIGKAFTRVRVGIGRPKSGDSIEYVLGDFKPSEQKIIEPAYIGVVLAIEDIILHGVEYASNKYNQQKE